MLHALPGLGGPLPCQSSQRRRGLERSVALRGYQQAIEKDPGICVGACRAGGCLYTLLADYGMVHPHQVMPLAESSARRALELDQNSAEVFTSLAIIRSLFEWNWAEGEDLSSTRHRAQPQLCEGSSLVWHRPVGAARAHGRGRRGDPARRAKLDPLSLMPSLENLGYIQMLRRNYDVRAWTLTAD